MTHAGNIKVLAKWQRNKHLAKL